MAGWLHDRLMPLSEPREHLVHEAESLMPSKPCHGPSPVHSPSGTCMGCVVLEPPPWGQSHVHVAFIHASTRHVAILWPATVRAEGMLGEGITCSSNQGQSWEQRSAAQNQNPCNCLKVSVIERCYNHRIHNWQILFRLAFITKLHFWLIVAQWQASFNVIVVLNETVWADLTPLKPSAKFTLI